MRRGRPNLQYTGGLFNCKHCGFAITGERIKRKRGNGGIREHIYYRCGNKSPAAEHPTLRWRESDLESAIIEHLGAFKFPSEDTAAWFREAMEAMFADREQLDHNRRRALNRRRTELADVEQQLSALPQEDLNQVKNVIKAFDFSQNLVNIWHRSNSAARRKLLDCVSLNRSLSDVSLYIAKRKPFDMFAERPFIKNSRGERIRITSLIHRLLLLLCQSPAV